MDHDPDDRTAHSAATAPLSDTERQALHRATVFVEQRQFAMRTQRAVRTGVELLAGLAIGAAIIAAVVVLNTRGTGSPRPAPAGRGHPTPSESVSPGVPTPIPTSTPLPYAALPYATFPAQPSCGDVDMNPDVEGLGTQHVWVVAAGNIVSSHDGGLTWRTEYSGGNPIGIDAIDDTHAWVVAPNGLLATTDGGNSWHLAGEPAAGPLALVHFDNDTQGFGIVYSTCAVVSTADGGQTWQPLGFPYKAQSLCFPGGYNGWIAAGLTVYHTSNTGLTWAPALTIDGAQYNAALRLQCAYPNAVSVLAHAQGGAAGNQPNAAWVSHDGGTFTQVFAGGMWNSGNSVPAGPGSYPGPLSIVSTDVTVWIGYTPAGATPVYMTESLANNALTRPQPVDCLGQPLGGAFVSTVTGWLVCQPFNSPNVIVLQTNNGGASWATQETIPG